MHSKKILVPLAIAATFYGCGGGGSGDSSSAPARPELSAISEATATKSVATAYLAGATLFDGSTSAAAAVGISAKSAVQRNPSVVEFSIGQLRTRRTAPGASTPDGNGSIATKAPIDEQESCDNGGTARIVGEIADPEGYLTTGDHASITFSNCEIDGVTVDGQLILSEIVVAEKTSTRFEFRKVRMAYQGETSDLDGSLHLSMPTDFDESAPIPVALREVSLQASAGGRTVTLSDVASDTTIDFGSGSFSYTMTGGVADSASGVSITLSTDVPFQGDYFTDTLKSGDMTVEGAKSSRARALVSALNQLTISVDADGDGKFEKSFDPIGVSELLED